jgi:hypothetical protein
MNLTTIKLRQNAEAYVGEIVQKSNELLHVRSRRTASVVGDYLCENILGILGKSGIVMPGRAARQWTWAPF